MIIVTDSIDKHYCTYFISLSVESRLNCDHATFIKLSPSSFTHGRRRKVSDRESLIQSSFEYQVLSYWSESSMPNHILPSKFIIIRQNTIVLVHRNNWPCITCYFIFHIFYVELHLSWTIKFNSTKTQFLYLEIYTHQPTE